MKTSFVAILIASGIALSFSITDYHEDSQEKEKAAVRKVIEDESAAFWKKDFSAFEELWVTEDYVRVIGWWDRGGVTVREGWSVIGEKIKQAMENNPDANPQNQRIENFNIRVSDNMAWVTFDQYGSDTGEPDMDMPGLSRETRILEKHQGKWKIVYVGWLLEGKPKK